VKQNAWRNGIKEVAVTYSPDQARIEWTPVEKIEQMWNEQTRPRREQERLQAEQEAIEAKRQAELFVTKGTLPFSEPLAIEMCERVSSGELLISICGDEHLPTVRRVTQWLRESPEFAALYKDSINDRLTIFEEEVIKIADDASRDFRDVVRNGRTTRVLDGDAIARAKLRVEIRLKHLRAFKPSIWGESQTLK
jgi:terminase small subunit-like protein